MGDLHCLHSFGTVVNSNVRPGLNRVGFGLKRVAFCRGALQLAGRVQLRRPALLAFAHGGHLLAAADMSCCIHVLDALSLRAVAVLREHVSTVAALAWAPGDRRLVSVGAAGAAYQARLRTQAVACSSAHASAFLCVQCITSGRPARPCVRGCVA